MRTPVLRLVGEQPSHPAAQEKFASESRDFGGEFWFTTLQGFGHQRFSTAPYLYVRPADAAAALGQIDENRHAVDVLAPTLTAFFESALRGRPAPDRLNVQADDFFAARSSAPESPNFPVASARPAGL